LSAKIALIHEDTAQRWEVSFEETFHRKFAVPNVDGHRHIGQNHIGFLQVGESTESHL
jgi:hypothetical protein